MPNAQNSRQRMQTKVGNRLYLTGFATLSTGCFKKVFVIKLSVPPPGLGNALATACREFSKLDSTYVGIELCKTMLRRWIYGRYAQNRAMTIATCTELSVSELLCQCSDAYPARSRGRVRLLAKYAAHCPLGRTCGSGRKSMQIEVELWLHKANFAVSPTQYCTKLFEAK